MDDEVTRRFAQLEELVWVLAGRSGGSPGGAPNFVAYFQPIDLVGGLGASVFVQTDITVQGSGVFVIVAQCLAELSSGPVPNRIDFQIGGPTVTGEAPFAAIPVVIDEGSGGGAGQDIWAYYSATLVNATGHPIGDDIIYSLQVKPHVSGGSGTNSVTVFANFASLMIWEL